MTEFFKQQTGMSTSKLLQGIAIALIFAIAFYMMLPAKVVMVPVPLVVEKEVVIKIPIKLNKNDRLQIQCLAENAYFEAGNQTTKGKIAVTNVVMNRADQGGVFPKTACGVIKQKTHGTCQFSWVCEGRKRITNYGVFNESKHIAEQVYLENLPDVTGGATFYHANYVRPSWSRQFDKTTQIGAHIFYRES